MVVNLALAVLAGFGLDNLLRRGLSKPKWLSLSGLGLTLLLTLVAGWGFRDRLQSWSQAHWPDLYHRLLAAFLDKGYTVDPIQQERLLLGWATWLTAPVFLLLLNIIAAFILFGLFAARRIQARTFSWLLIAAISLDLLAAGGTTINPTRPATWWHQLSAGGQFVLENLGEARVFPLGMGSEQLAVSHLGQYFPSVYRIRSAGGHGSSLMLARLSLFLQNAHPVQAIQVLGVRYLLTEGQLGADAAATYPLAYNDQHAFVYENKAPLPRAFLVHEVIQVATPAEALAHFEGVTFDPRRTVVLEAPAGIAPPEPPSANSLAAITTENPQQVEIEVNAAAAGYLVLLDTFYPGWISTVDGQTTPIYPANVIGRAVFVPAGQHTVQFYYWPVSFRLGLWLSAFMVLLLIVANFNRPQRIRT
jgi:hypothetical protein